MRLLMRWTSCIYKRPLGLRNLVNSGYLSSVLQCLTYTVPLADFCLGSKHSSICPTALAGRGDDCLFCVLEWEIGHSLTIHDTFGTPYKIHNLVIRSDNEFEQSRQEDAHEFLRYITEACSSLHPDGLESDSSSSSDSADDTSPGYPDGEELGIMHKIFGGELMSQVKCTLCNGKSDKTDRIMDVSLDVYQSNTLNQALERFFQPEVLDGSNMYKCDKCNKLAVAKKQLYLQRAPNVLVIHLKRFDGLYGKIDDHIGFEEDLLLSKFMRNPDPDLQLKYNLFGSIVHSGFSPQTGHYYAYIKDALGRWYCCDDAKVSPSSTECVLSQKVYMLFYRRQTSAKTIKYKSRSKTITAEGKKSDEVDNDSSVKKCSGFEKPEMNNILYEKKPCSQPTTVKDEQVSSLPKDNAAVGSASDMLEHGNEQKQSVSPRAECIPLKHGEDKDTGKQNLAPVKDDETDCNHSPDHISNNSDSSNSKRKSCDAGRASTPPLCSKEATSLSTSDDTSRAMISNHTNQSSDPSGNGSSSALNISYINQSSEEFEELQQELKEDFEELKEELVREAYQKLQSCGWSDSLHKFMGSRKRLWVQETGSCPNNDESRKQLKNDARNTFSSQIPESVKSDLVELLIEFIKKDGSS